MSTAPQATRRPAGSGLDIHVGAVIGSGLVGIVYAIYTMLVTPPPMNTLVFAALGLVAGVCAVKIPGVNALVSASDTFFITSAMLFGPAPAMVAIALDSAGLAWRRGYDIRRLLFNAALPAVSLGVATGVFQLLGGSPLDYSTPISATILPLTALTGIYFGLNSGLLAVAIALESNAPIATVWRRLWPLSMNYIAAASAAFCFVIVIRSAGWMATLAVAPLVVVLHLTLRSVTGRLSDAERYVQTVDKLYLSTIETLATAIEAKDGVTSDHIRRVQKFAIGLANALGVIDENTIKAINAAALLHDTGKLAVPEYILNKPGKLTALEFEQMKLHVDVGADILSAIEFPYPVVPIVRAHHENWDGTGYPRGLKGEEIPIGARILSVVDCYDALTSDRPYRPAMTDTEALAIIRARRGTMYDPTVVDIFERVCRDIGPMTVKPQLQKAIQQITRAAAPAAVDARPPAAVPAPLPANEGPESLRALANLARVVSGRPTSADLASLIWSHVHHVVPNASCAFFVNEPASDSVKVTFVAGDAASMLQGLEMKLGERLTGWVAEHQQAMVNSDAKLDLGSEAALYGLKYCLALPLVADGQLAGVLSLYSTDSFKEDQTETLQFVMPHLGQMFLSLPRRGDSPPVAAAKPPLRVVASR